MKLIRNAKTCLTPDGSVVAIGNFEGIHLGHQAVLDKLVVSAKSKQLPSWVVTFEPSPKQYFMGKTPTLRLMTLSEKLKGLASKQVDGVLCLTFAEKLKEMSPQDFVEDILVGQLQCRHLFVGDDFRFGHQREGDVNFLKAQGKIMGFEVFSLPQVAMNGERFSSTLIRNHLACGDVASIERILGRPFSLGGRVIKGEQKGRLLGFPTANIKPPKIFLPQYGVYYVRVQGLEKPYHGVANLGVRPTVDGTTVLCETHIFDFTGDLYGKKLTIELMRRIRPEKRFESLDALRSQISQDVQQAKSYL